ncbi:glycosyltransferase family 4 protein [Rheinheimera sp. MM224]|uniref:glycosyltransferase family 4 protein n=1 Tax=Rheinheimera sp. MM224 TaxID=3019969 RepID=UPI0021F8F951|nr:glycosyltransferase family 4 protein [Rheinheimera sp. MM224]CAI3796509.1 D-inositol-3-phosphate glycosyltransferase [Rheinheimera sp. MM224]
MKIIAFVGETFEAFDDYLYAKPTSAAFLQDAVGSDNVYVCSPVMSAEVQPERFSTKVQAKNFHPFPKYSSTKDFVIKSLLKPGFFAQYAKVADDVIRQHSGAYFWIRTPSVGSIVFGLRALKAGEKVLHHMCADASNTWRDAKYSGFEKVLGYVLSRYIRFKLKQICRHPDTLNLCTGNALEEFSKAYAPDRTFQFVDVMVKPPKELTVNSYTPGFLNILFVGRLVEDKGVFDLLHVVSEMADKCRVTFVGDGPDLEAAKLLSAKLGVDNIVNFTGQLPHQQLSDIYNDSDLVVVPSNNNYEGFPRVIMEAWSHHKPVVVADVGGIRAFVKDGENGLIFPPGDRKRLYQCIQSVVQDQSTYNKVRAGAELMAAVSIQDYWLEVLNSKLR